MESNRTETKYAYDDLEFPHNVGKSDDIETRLDELVRQNRETALEHDIFRDEQERFEASLLKNPLTSPQAFALFGLMLGTFPPLAIFGKITYNQLSRGQSPDFLGIFVLFLVANFMCGFVGYFSGKLIGGFIEQIEKLNWTAMLGIAPFIGILWGVMTGGAGGLFIFVIGAFFGAAVAAIIGAIALPLMTIFHRLLKKGNLIERDQILPIAAGISLAISALILSLSIS